MKKYLVLLIFIPPVILYFISFRPSVEGYTRCIEEVNERIFEWDLETFENKPSRNLICAESREDLLELENCLSSVKDSYFLGGIYLKYPGISRVFRNITSEHNHFCSGHKIDFEF